MRILLSGKAAAEVGPRIARIAASPPLEILTPPEGLAADFDIAFVSRDVTGRSTKLQVEPETQRFHDALRQAKSLRWVHIHSAGADRPIYPELQARGVTVTTSSGANASIVAQSALAGILALARKLPLLLEQQKARVWKSLFGALPRDLAGQSVVILGWGPIGRQLAALLQALGLKVAVVRFSAEAADSHPTYPFDRLMEAAAGADWLVIACPLTERTRGRIGREVIEALAADAHLVNVGRGEIVVEAELVQALRSGRLAGAYLDVFEREPLPAESPLWAMPNVIVTPHSAGLSDGNGSRVAQMFLDNLSRWVEKRPLLRVASPPRAVA